MASDMVVALGPAAVGGVTLFGANCYARSAFPYRFRQLPARTHSLDETIRSTHLQVPQARQTLAVLGCLAGDGWGLNHGVNEQRVAVGVTGWNSRLPAAEVGLTGTELVRLTLERGHSAMQAVDVLTDLISRHGQCFEPGGRPGNPADNIFLLADAKEAFVVEAAGRFWALQECRQVRSVTGVGLIRQDWGRLAQGLVGHALEQRWWDGEGGGKLDFACYLDPHVRAHSPARRRWGRMTVALEQQNGAIDADFLRRMYFSQYDSVMAQTTHRPPAALAGTFLTALQDESQPVLAWAALGPPSVAVYFPLWLDGELPTGVDRWYEAQHLLANVEVAEVERRSVTEGIEQLQATFDQDAESLQAQMVLLKERGDFNSVRIAATELMQKHLDLYTQVYRKHKRPELAV